MKSQNKAILEALQAGRKLTPLDALAEFNCMRLGGRIHNLRQLGHNIITETVEVNGKRFASYSMGEGQNELF